MTMNYVPLDKDKHKDLKVKLSNNFTHAKDAHLAAASIREFAQLASCMPIVFITDPKTESTHAVVVLGLEQGVNLFLKDEKWLGHAVPLNIVRYPFDVRPDGDKLGVFIDENCELVGDKEGEPLFTDKGEPSPYLENRQQLLSELANSEMATQDFIKKITELNLLDNVALNAKYANGQTRNINGMQTINESRLKELSDETILELNKTGYLGAIYAVLMSLGQLNRIIQLTSDDENPVAALRLQVEKPETEKEAEPA